MKRGKRRFIYFFSITFCCLFFLFFTNYQVRAIDESSFLFSCIDKNTSSSCNELTEEAYYLLNSISVDEASVDSLVIPSTYDDGNNGEWNVEGIGSSVLTDNLSVNTLVLPNNLVYIEDLAFDKLLSLEEVTFPTTLRRIGARVFDGTSINNIYLNHYNFFDLEVIEIDENAFLNAQISKIICGNHSVYNYYKSNPNSTLKDKPIVALVTYNYHAYENESLADILDSVEYYIGDNQTITSIPEDLSVEGLIFLGWYLKNGDIYTKIEVDNLTSYNLYTTSYNIYPRFELKDLTFNISSTSSDGENVTSIRYNGNDDLVMLNVSNLSHDLIGDSNFSCSVSWYKVILGHDELVSSENNIYLSRVEESGTYKGLVVYEYLYEGFNYRKESYVTKNITITRAPLYILVDSVSKSYGEYLNQADLSYTPNGLLGDDTIDLVDYEYPHSGNIEVGSYLNSIKLEVKSISNNEVQMITNYDIVYSYGNYTVTPKRIEVYFDELVEYTYGSDIEISKVISDEHVYGSVLNEIKIIFAKEAGINVGEYSIIGVKEISNTNYIANFNPSLSEDGLVKINPKAVETYADVNSYIYDGEEKELSVYYIDVNKKKVELSYSMETKGSSVDKIINAGSYTIYINSLNDANYVFADNNYRVLIVNIEKAVPVVNYGTYQSFTYSGSRINPNISINNSEQTPIYSCTYGGLQGDYCVNAGNYSVMVTYNESDNYRSFTTNAITLSISRYVINLSPKNFNFYYGEDVEASEELTINGEKVLARYTTDARSGSEIGNYNIIGVVIKNINNGADHGNYVGAIIASDCLNKVKIISRPITIVYYNYDGLVYDGNEKLVGAYAVDNLSNKVVEDLDLNVVCQEGIIKDAKTYHLRTYFDNEHYNAINSNLLEFTISKAKYNLPNISFKDARFTLNFKKHSIEVDGDLPEGVSVKYTIDGKEGNSTSSAFSHKVVATFVIDSLNYLPIDSMEASIYIDMSWVFVTIALIVIIVSISLCLSLLYLKYRREHPKKIKLKIKTIVNEDLEAKRIATSVKEVLGDEAVESEKLENEDDIIENNINSQTFIERIYAADSELKYYYSEVKNELLSYEGITHTVDRKYEVFYHGTRQIAKLSICNNVLRLYVNLDPAKYDKTQYNHRDMSNFECHARTPLRLDVNTSESLRHAKVFIRILRKRENLKAVSSFVRIDYEKFYTLKENVFPKIFKKMFSIKNKNKK